MSTSPTPILEGFLNADAKHFDIIASRFNHMIVDRLVEGAQDTLKRHGADMSKVRVLWVPGAWELPLAAQKSLQGKVDAVIVLGAVIRGATPHFDVVVNQCASALSKLQLEKQKPVALGLLTTNSIEEAIERSGTKHGNKGIEATLAAIESANLLDAMG